MSLRSTLLATTAITASALLLAGCSSAAAGDDDTVRIGVVGASDPYWATYEKAAEDAGIDVEIVDFTDYNQPNPALSEGEIDLNQFQHLVYLSQYNTSADADLVPIGATAIYPLGLYSTQYDSVDDIPEGATVAVPDDESNQARGLLVLQSAGLIELKDGGSIFSSIDDVDTAKSEVEVTALDAALTATSLPDVAAAIVNNDYLEGAGLAATDAIAEDDPSDPNAIPYVNVFAARSEDADNATYTKLVEIYQNTQAVLDGVSENSGGTAIFVKTPADELQSTLETVEKDTAAQAG
ncbi:MULTISPECIES: MetQ/NlpA family ABC transporter substrate-binding protein [unclassified Rathayibacter]|uniref:MetQ/NlpA family ABC transporter substrate-binding protein n=1 Tax=unclassified Rathayibacter TaxID=2609250 RepID=UPI000700FED8|nr:MULTISPECIES: MetQ/NlpA family ABC transporter substrate-binding protein [unclassified Rathayibacter]KQQ05740.1 methionine ABC transporter substrate-binding protein [Rathayibacter sp. Leaf294]KQS13598.1 methionine ABC transporter substrate-binding protein [Rathayibacter sp. Leaf185]